MSSLAKKVTKLCADLQRQYDLGRESQVEVDKIKSRVAALLLQSLGDEHHPLFKDLQLLQELAANAEWQERARAKNIDPNRLFFMPEPGTSDSAARRYWPLQLLLHTASGSDKHLAGVAQVLPISETHLRQALASAARAVSSIGAWSASQYLRQLIQAVSYLDYPDPPIPFRQEGRFILLRDGTKFRLSPAESRLLQMLLDNIGEPVRRSRLVEAGINNPKQAKLRLCAKFRLNDVNLPIESPLHSYRLPESWL